MKLVISLENTIVKCQTTWESPKMPRFPFLKVTFSVSFVLRVPDWLLSPPRSCPRQTNRAATCRIKMWWRAAAVTAYQMRKWAVARPQIYTSHTSWLRPAPLGTDLMSVRACEGFARPPRKAMRRRERRVAMALWSALAISLRSRSLRTDFGRLNWGGGGPVEFLQPSSSCTMPQLLFLLLRIFFATEEICGLMLLSRVE